MTEAKNNHAVARALERRVRGCFRWILRTLKIGEFAWEYGIFKYDTPARRHVRKGNVQFVLWKAGDHGHAEDFWYDADRSWWPSFEASPNE
jgi:hypothetical protein